MSTNYYHQEKIYKKCDHCGRDAEYKEIHIGKYSNGWRFSFSNKFNSAKKWIEFLSNTPGIIVDEYAKEISISDFENIIKSTLKFEDKYSQSDEFLDAEGYRIIDIDQDWQ